MKADELKQKFIKFFISKNHNLIPNASLIPENDPSALFINSGMHPLVPYLLGNLHPLGKRLTSIQKCVRTDDIDEVGDTYHHTFFEMLGNWSLGDYFKKEAIHFSYEFLTKHLNLDPKRLSVSVFTGDKDAPRDEESAQIWSSLKISSSKIFYYGKKENWWQVGLTGPCGPDTEVFYDTGQKPCCPKCHPNCQCGKYCEIWNDVFMVYNRDQNGKLHLLPQKNVDTGLGLDRTTAILQGRSDDYQTELFLPIVKEIEKISQKTYQQERKSFRIIADHLRAAAFIISAGVEPSNKDRGYILRRLTRRAIRHGKLLGQNQKFTTKIAEVVIKTYQKNYPELKINQKKILQNLDQEEEKFQKTLGKGLKEFEKAKEQITGKTFPGETAFYLYETYGFPLELTQEIAQEKNLKVNIKGFEEAKKSHQKKSRASLTKKFKSGLADASEQVVKLHAATHLLHQALRDVLGSHVKQAGSNITAQRLRFDFTHSEKLTNAQTKKIEKVINQKIKENLPVKAQTVSLKKARQLGAIMLFGQKYPPKVKVYKIGDYSKEVCSGPHVPSTAAIGSVKIKKQEACGAGKRRIYAVLQ